MSILVIHEVDWLKKVVYEVHDIPELLSLRGHRVTVIDYEEAWSRQSPFDLARLRTEIVRGASRAFVGAQVELRRPGIVKVKGLDRIASLATQFLEIRRTLAHDRVDVILLYAMPTSGLSAIWQARRSGVPVVFRAIDVLHELRPKPLSLVIELAERLGYPAVDRIVALTPRMKNYVCALGASREHVEVLLPGIDTRRFVPARKDTELLARYGLDTSDKVVLFMGTLYAFAGLDLVISRFGDVLEVEPKARLVIVGGAGVELQLRALAAACPFSQRIVFTGFVDYTDLARHINLADLTINPFRDIETTRNVFPGKVLQYLACGKPLLATPLEGITQVLGGERHGVVFSALKDAYMQCIGQLLSDDSRRARLGLAARRYVESNHSWDEMITRLEGILAGAIGERR